MVKNLPANAGDNRLDPWVRTISWRRKWQPPPVFLPGRFHGQRSLGGCSPWGHRESDRAEHEQDSQLSPTCVGSIGTDA